MPTGVLHLKEVDTDEITLDGTLSVSGASTLEGAAVAHSTLSVGGAATLADASATNVNVSGTLSVAGQTTMGGDIIPDTNDAYDIGSPEFKIRDLYVSNNSIWVGDDMKISNEGGKLKFRKRKTDVVPQAILDAGANAGHTNEQATADAALAHAGVGDLGSMKLQHWFKFMRTLNSVAKITDIFRDTDDDYEESSASDAWKEINNTKIYTDMNVGVGTSDPDDTLHVKGSFKVESETGFKLIRSSVGGTDPTVIIDTQNFGTDETVNDLTGRGDAKYTKLYRVYGRNSEGVGRSWYWGYANDDYANISLAFDGGGIPDPDIAFTFTTASELHCNKVYAALGGNADTATLAAEATKLATPRKINGVDFDGTQDITTSSVDGITSVNGNIGVGKTNPQLDFDVGGNGDNTRFGRSTTGSIHGADKRNQMRIGRFDQFDTIGDQGFLGMRLMVDTAANLGMSGEADNQSAIQFYTWGNNVANSREVMRINSLGNVGIGTSSPGKKLEIAHGYQSLGAYMDTYRVSGVVGGAVLGTRQGGGAYKEAVHITDSGFVGVGTNNPSSLLEVATTSTRATMSILSKANDGCAELKLSEYSQNYGFNIAYDGGPNVEGTLGYGNNKFHIISRDNSTTGTPVITIPRSNKMVGINTTNPRARLHVEGKGDASLTSAKRTWIHNTHGDYHGTGTWGDDISIYGSRDIVAGDHVAAHGGAFTSSDRRIKKDIIDIDDGSALETLRLLKPKKYNYLDVIRRGADPVWGFIAQEVSEVLPYSTSLRKDFIPNIYQVSSVEETPGDQNIITFTSFDTTLLKSKTNIQLKVMDLNDEEHIVQVEEILNLHSIRVKEDLSKIIDENRKIFVYGQEVDDFMFLKKESIFTVATAALQEVDRQLQAEKIRNDALQARLARIEAELNLN